MYKAVRIVVVVIIVFVCLVGAYGVVAYLGWEQGQRQRNELAATEQQAEIVRQIAFARNDIAQDNPGLALRRLEWVLEQDPANDEALSLQLEIQEATNHTSVATPVILQAPTAEATPIPVSETTEESEPEQRFRQLQALINNKEWTEAITGLIAFQRAFPDFQRRTTDEMLFAAYITYGTDLLYTENAELGLAYLRQAEQLGDLPQEASDQRQWARLYLSGISFYNVNWDVAIFYFRELCLSAPFFHNACDQLENALVSYADQYITIQEWCPAEPLLAEAYSLFNNQEVANKLGNARARCANATPVFTNPFTGTNPLTGTLPFTDTLPVSPPVIELP